MNQRTAGIALSYATLGVQVVVMLAYTPFVLRILGQEEFGLYQLVQSVIAALGMLSLGFSGAYVRFFTRFSVAGDREGMASLNGMFMTVFLCMGAVALAVGAVLACHAPKLLHASATLQELHTARALIVVMSANMALSFPQAVFICNLTANERFTFQRGMGFLVAIASPLLTIPFLLKGCGSLSIVAVTLALNALSFLLAWRYSVKNNRMEFNFLSFRWGLLKEVWLFSAWLFLNFITDQINWNAGRFILGKMVGTQAVAVFAVGALINTMYLAISTSISSVYVPLVNKMVEEQSDHTSLTGLFIRIGRAQFFILFYILGGFILLGQYFMKIWAGPAYANAYWVALLLIVPVTFPLIQNLGIDIMKAKNMHRFRSIAYLIGSLVNILISLVLVIKWQEIGVAIGTCVALTIFNIFIINWYYHKRIGLDIVLFWKDIAWLFLKTVSPILICSALILKFPVSSFHSFILYGILYSSLYALMLYGFGLNSEERFTVRRLVMPRVKR